ncbi:hypothetical protein [Microvirga alba]|uniref:Uncharacterized protein n=1 Tax=Microvirga alba TaxID=2791025 RepID=A0A931BT39_9HYPH|nr:hypothetical protein [Microvirga alba]MBF9234284.1 hypothetical protein [Microvirga alba]
MSSAENEKNLQRVLYREAFERRDIAAEAEKRAQEADARASRKYGSLKKWLQIRDSIPPILYDLNKRLSVIGAEIRVSQTIPHDYSHPGYPSIGRGRLDFFIDGKRTTRVMEADLSESGIVHLYMYLPKETKRLEIDISEIDRDRIEALLIEFVNLATQDDFPIRT